MAYREFSLEQVIEIFGCTFQEHELFSNISPIAPDEWMRTLLTNGMELALPNGSEIARKNYIVAPILLDVRLRNHKHVAIYAGATLNADIDKGLNGECDFILSLSDITAFVDAPIMSLVEAERHDMTRGLGQCAAQMVGASIFNQKKAKPIKTIYGCVTTGADWQFLSLCEQTLTLDAQTYYIHQLPELLGIFQMIVEANRG